MTTDDLSRAGLSCVRLVLVGASAGGTQALQQLLPALPADFPCVAVVQHIWRGFIDMLCADIGRKCQMQAGIASDGANVENGKIYFAGEGRQLLVAREDGALRLRLGSANKVSGHCPSADALFSSAASCAAPECIGVILTGMGADGAAGLLRLKEAGAYTIGQDEKSCAIYGMPRAAFACGAVARQLPLQAIAAELIRRARPSMR